MDVCAQAGDGPYVPHMSPHWLVPSHIHDTWEKHVNIFCLKDKRQATTETKKFRMQGLPLCLKRTLWYLALSGVLFYARWVITNSLLQYDAYKCFSIYQYI
jgi:hypothetical protein